MIKSFKFKIKRPSKAVVARFEQTLSLCRELYNAALQERRDAWNLNRVSVSYYDQANQLSEIRKIRDDLQGDYSQILQDVLRRTDKTFKAFFARVKKGEKSGFPRFKSINFFDTFTYPQKGFQLTGNKLQLSKIGQMRIRLSQEIIGKIKTCTIKRGVDGWFIILAVETDKEILPKTGKSIGIDVGIKTFATLSNGELVANPKFLRQSEQKLKVAQRKVSRKRRGSIRRKKSVVLLKKHHLKITRQRLDFFHKESLKLVRKYDEIAVEGLNIKIMVKNHHLAKSISDASWGNFLIILTAKAENAGRVIWKVDARNTSQNCSGCGEKVPKSLSVRIHQCPACGLTLDRDLNAAKNILNRAVGQTVETLTYPAGESAVSESLFCN